MDLHYAVKNKMTNRTVKVIAIGGALLSAHLVLRELRKREAIVRYVDHIPGNFTGICIPPVGVFIIKKQQGNSELLKHELVHWSQYQRMGLFSYYGGYLLDYLKHGYDKHPMEYEARQNENEYCRINYTECVRDGKARTVFNPNFRA